MSISHVNDSEVAKHKKKKQSDTSKSSKKSRHKHIYEPVLYVFKFHENASPIGGKRTFERGEKCSICGKLKGYDPEFWTRFDNDEFRGRLEKAIKLKFKNNDISVEELEKIFPEIPIVDKGYA